MTFKNLLDTVKDHYYLHRIFKPEALTDFPLFRVEFGQGYPKEGSYSWSSCECFRSLEEAKNYTAELKDSDISFFRIKTATRKDFDPELSDTLVYDLLREDLTEVDWACLLQRYLHKEEDLMVLTRLFVYATYHKHELCTY